ncbi:uncharacterized protein N7506_001304 [Penicillium brevicompactum]|uniref:uncharacterized protein n=1 Tax=Penicillium brevicompactum TaxID=5074 RepID=UPI00254196C4|nr:uncharacterized protein N7506_001304 [Penicillium brevicompactum]KAJ5348051.1 hypothetical protein N7506_001304 [Penicillium brevicompactum]
MLLSDFTSRIEELISKHHVPGLSVAVLSEDQVTSAGFGSASIEPPLPCTADTLFDVASCAKSITAASVAILVEDNEDYHEIKYDALMSNLLPEDFVMSCPGHSKGVMVEDLLSHRTGMAPHDNSYFGPQAECPDNAASVTRNLRNLAVAAPLRSRYLYCNMMYTVLTHLIEVKSKLSFSDFLEDRIFLPLAMNSSSLQPANARAKGLGDRIATGYIWNKTSGYRECQCADCPEGQGAGSVITSANDFIKWVKALVNQEGPITQKVYQGLVRPRSFPNYHPARLKPFTSPPLYAAGVDIYYYRGHMVVGHNGVVPGFGARFAFIPSIKFGAVVMGNSSEAGIVAGILIRELIDDALGILEPDKAAGVRVSKVGVNPSESTKAGEKKKQKRSRPPKNSKPEHQSNRPSDANKTKPDMSQPDDEVEPQVKPLHQYTGHYWNSGYRGITVQIVDNRLFVDASDRAMGFTLTFHHISDQTKYTAKLVDAVEGGSDPIEAEFLFEGDEVAGLGLNLELSLRKLIWFHRVNGNTEGLEKCR